MHLYITKFLLFFNNRYLIWCFIRKKISIIIIIITIIKQYLSAFDLRVLFQKKKKKQLIYVNMLVFVVISYKDKLLYVFFVQINFIFQVK